MGEAVHHGKQRSAGFDVRSDEPSGGRGYAAKAAYGRVTLPASASLSSRYTIIGSQQKIDAGDYRISVIFRVMDSLPAVIRTKYTPLAAGSP